MLDDGGLSEKMILYFKFQRCKLKKRKATADLLTLQGSIELRYNLVDFSGQADTRDILT